VATVGQAAQDRVVGSQLMFVGSVGIWGAEDYVAFAVVGDCDVLVAAGCLDGESSGVVSVELGEWYVCNLELIGEEQLGGACCLVPSSVTQWVVHQVRRVLQSNLKMGEVWAWWSIGLGTSI
jgi:hypothetical protein